MGIVATTAESPSQDGFRFPVQPRRTRYAIEVTVGASGDRLEGKEEIVIRDVSMPAKNLVLDFS